MAENELADTYAIREALFVCREKARNMLITQQERAEHAIRKRIFETQRARNELQWQQMKVSSFIYYKNIIKSKLVKESEVHEIFDEFSDERGNGESCM